MMLASYPRQDSDISKRTRIYNRFRRVWRRENTASASQIIERRYALGVEGIKKSRSNPKSNQPRSIYQSLTNLAPSWGPKDSFALPLFDTQPAAKPSAMHQSLDTLGRQIVNTSKGQSLPSTTLQGRTSSSKEPRQLDWATTPPSSLFSSGPQPILAEQSLATVIHRPKKASRPTILSRGSQAGWGFPGLSRQDRIEEDFGESPLQELPKYEFIPSLEPIFPSPSCKFLSLVFQLSTNIESPSYNSGDRYLQYYHSVLNQHPQTSYRMLNPYCRIDCSSKNIPRNEIQ